jgi:uncharacterized Zn finger protein
MKKSKKTLHNLSWADLEAWAGTRIISRGTSYQKSGYVRELAVTSDGGLIAWVRGTENYATSVTFVKGRLSSDCTCPFAGNCKHAVAVVLEYLDRLKKHTKVPLAAEDDDRLLLLDEASLEVDDDDDLLEDDEIYDFTKEDEIPSAGAGVKSSLKKKSKKELETMLSGILKNHPELTKEVGFAPRASGKKGCETLAKAVTKAIVTISREPAWRNYWRHEGHTPDYSPVRKGLLRLLDEGCTDEVVKLGDKLFSRGIEQIKHSHDEGETANEIAGTMPIVFKALARCSLPETDKLERAIDYGLRDDYGLCQGLDGFLGRKFGKKSWSDVADRLLARLGNMKPETGERAFSRNYQRDHLSGEVVRALGNAGRDDEAIAVCFQEAEATGSYERLVKKLRETRRTGEAEEWIRKGVRATQDKLPGIASSLKSALLEIRQEKKDWPFAAALRADDFFGAPSLKAFKEFQKACEKTKDWPEVRKACMIFLETGVHPGGKVGWPLPDTGFGKPEKSRRGTPPFTDVLIDIAINEKRVDDVVHWYEVQKQKASDWFVAHRDDEVATAVASEYPDRAVAIWKRIAEWHIGQTNVGNYSQAVNYLKKVRKLQDGLVKAADWADYLEKLTETNKRKTRLVQMLNALSGKPILSSK